LDATEADVGPVTLFEMVNRPGSKSSLVTVNATGEPVVTSVEPDGETETPRYRPPFASVTVTRVPAGTETEALLAPPARVNGESGSAYGLPRKSSAVATIENVCPAAAVPPSAEMAFVTVNVELARYPASIE
jgi:hypothetical protein